MRVTAWVVLAISVVVLGCSSPYFPGAGFETTRPGDLATSEPTEDAGVVEPTIGPRLTIAKVALTSTVRHGADASLTIKTSPRADCGITVVYSSGPSSAAGLVPRETDATGKAKWSWKVGTRTAPGTYPITISCVLGDRFGELGLTLRVT